MIFRSDNDDTFFNYGYDEEKSKPLYLYQKRRIPESFSDTLFSDHKHMT